ncbi:DNA-directed RNA polymerase II subunit RPB3 [Nematocida sp. AWRm77]|nr:DNA-directed RNA polymerase II subunit RPB3 [Nematocida sp. AWRm77]
MVKIEIDEVGEENVKFKLRETSLAFANALRRVLLTEIPTLAIDIVQYDKNYTVLPEEMITDRLGLIPINSATVENYLYTEDCVCKEYCSQCSITIELDVSNTMSESERVVTSKDFFIEKDSPDVGDQIYPSLITKLGRNQAIKCKCIAVKGRGKVHSKWSPVTTVGFGYDSSNKFRHTKYWHEQNENAEWPTPWFAEQGTQAQSQEYLCGEEPDTFYFDVEVVRGCLKPMEVLRRGVRILKEKLQTLLSSIENE